MSVEVAVQNTYCLWKAHEVDNDYVKDLHGTDMVSAFQDGDSDLDSEADFEARRCDQVEEKAKEYLREKRFDFNTLYELGEVLPPCPTFRHRDIQGKDISVEPVTAGLWVRGPRKAVPMTL